MHRKRKPKTTTSELTEGQILAWADAFHSVTGRWPTQQSAPRAFPGAPAERWAAIDLALLRGYRGLPGGSSLAQLLAARRGRRNQNALPRLTVARILQWCDEFHMHTGAWPHHDTAPGTGIPGSAGDTWKAIDSALRNGRRGLSGGSSLARVLAEHREVANPADRPRLTVKEILAWADAHHARTGRWPGREDRQEQIPGSVGETWGSVTSALAIGLRGLPRGVSLPGLMAKHRGVRNVARLPRLTIKQVLAWADAFRARTGRWPTDRSSPQTIPGTRGEQWRNVNAALHQGRRGFPGGYSLAQLLAEHRGVRNHMRLPRLSIQQILTWADAFHAKTGTWPTRDCSPQLIDGTHDERWSSVAKALWSGNRGLPGGSSLARLLARHRGVPIRNRYVKSA
jgi:hypothetical protein